MYDTPSNNSKAVTSEYNYTFILTNGTRLNLDKIFEDIYINVTIPIRNLNLSNFKYAKIFKRDSYDIYKRNSKFYKDICSSALISDNNIILRDRQVDIYLHNITLCKGNCKYYDVEIEEIRIVCECNLNNDLNGIIMDDDYLMEKTNEKFIKYLLDSTNYKIFKCYHLLIYSDNYSKNIAFYIIISIYALILFLSFKFIFFKIRKLKELLYNEKPTQTRLKNYLFKLRKRKQNSKKFYTNINKKI